MSGFRSQPASEGVGRGVDKTLTFFQKSPLWFDGMAINGYNRGIY